MYNLDIVIVEDDPQIGELLVFNLQNNEYEPHLFQNGYQMFDGLPKLMPVSLFILDIMLPGIDGFEICRRLKSNPDTEAIPVLILSARGSESDRIRGLTIGADDYMSKPFGIRELVARVDALLRRYGRIRTFSSGTMAIGASEGHIEDNCSAMKSEWHDESAKGEPSALEDRRNTDAADDAVMAASVSPGQQRADIRLGAILIDDLRHRVYVNDVEVEMANREYELLKFLVQHPGAAFSREQLLHEVWGHQTGYENSDTRTVDIHIFQVRHKIEIEDPDQVRIETLRGFGYRLVDPSSQSRNSRSNLASNL